MDQTTLGSGSPGHVVLCATQKQAEKALGSKPESHDPPLPLVQIQSLGSCPSFLQWWTAIRWNKHFLVQVAFGHSLDHSNGKQIKILWKHKDLNVNSQRLYKIWVQQEDSNLSTGARMKAADPRSLVGRQFIQISEF